jgi:hypothetical protein
LLAQRERPAPWGGMSNKNGIGDRGEETVTFFGEQR